MDIFSTKTSPGSISLMLVTSSIIVFIACSYISFRQLSAVCSVTPSLFLVLLSVAYYFTVIGILLLAGYLKTDQLTLVVSLGDTGHGDKLSTRCVDSLSPCFVSPNHITSVSWSVLSLSLLSRDRWGQDVLIVCPRVPKSYYKC